MEIYRFGLVGGGEGAFIGAVHRTAAELDGRARLVCGAFSTDSERSVRSGTQLYGLAESACYASAQAMFDHQQTLPADQRMQLVIIATPNDSHAALAEAALSAGFHVVCDKPLALNLAQAQRLQQQVEAGDQVFALTHNYAGYPMVIEARELIRSGALGRIRRVDCHYLQGWLARAEQNKQASWRTDPSRAGLAGCFGDIGSHAHHLVEFVLADEVQSVCADLSTHVADRQLDDDGNVLLRMTSGAKGVISASQIAVGRENDLSLQVYGELGGLEWCQSDANSLTLRRLDASIEVRRTAGAGLSTAATAAARLPAGHPEGYLQAFANIYAQVFDHLAGAEAQFPDVTAGVRGMRFIEAVVRSSADDARWVQV